MIQDKLIHISLFLLIFNMIWKKTEIKKNIKKNKYVAFFYVMKSQKRESV